MTFRLFVLSLLLMPLGAFAGIPNLTVALQNTYRACVGIDDDLAEMKRMAGINTAITGVGTGMGVGATATGFAKAKLDKKIEEWERVLNQKIAEQQKNGTVPNQIISESVVSELLANYDAKSVGEIHSKLALANKKSKKLGNWRSGLLAGETLTNIAGSVMAGNNKVDIGLQEKINNCIGSVNILKNAIAVARVAGADINEADRIYNACREYEYLDLSPINKRATGAMLSSVAGAVTAGVGTVTSLAANSDKVRNDNTNAGKSKEKQLNKTANILATGSTIASASATIFNASQIAAIKKVAVVSEACTKALK